MTCSTTRLITLRARLATDFRLPPDALPPFFAAERWAGEAFRAEEDEPPFFEEEEAFFDDEEAFFDEEDDPPRFAEEPPPRDA